MSLSFHAFFPTLTATLGYNRTVTLLLCAPPWVFAALVAFAVARYLLLLFRERQQIYACLQALRCNRREVLSRDRFPVRRTGRIRDCILYHEHRRTILFTVSGINPPFLAGDSKRDSARFLMTQSFAAFITFFAWVSSTFPRPSSKRAVAIAFISAFSQLGNIPGSYIWPKSWGETYRYSYAICIAASGLSIVMILAFRAHLKALNEKAEKEERKRGLPKGYRYLL
jgi:hypothetical protein